ncbi:MAG: nitroreductase family protein [Acidimicrobiia bacterium]|nr:nitroreductase family protein [Acidimicrobiia bacterium]MDH4366464.1 nitroreductase family protein [Acidimicrobiia bacterium]
MDVLEAIRTRRAIRSYRPDPVDKATLTEVIGLATCAPSGLNRQPWSFAVIEGRERLADLETAARAAWLDDDGAVLASQPPAVAQHVRELLEAGFPIFHDAPAAIVLLVPSGDRMATIDTALAGQTLMLAAHGMGLATCPVALGNLYLNLPQTRADLGLPADGEVMLTILIGTADGPWPDMPARHEPTVYWC